ncbi:Alpha-L-fucosidase [Rubripirellula tenax]|uniref:alpha-L-fucosidase n=1 Tax=Rubripirellula tenax TaxID=2528015 RepID=A0A5C6END2_9BACT|nr:alpha-L-fucosidase [Rubripirellula tenax]TWU50602.1 Alpha-L-fucosidase [Rubripirellula tenax]
MTTKQTSSTALCIALLLTPLLSAYAEQPLASVQAQTATSNDSAWFNEAKFGMFIHWGVYSKLERGEWVMNKERIPITEYKKLASEFNPIKFDADAWVAVAKAAGMKYITITSKHHDGFAMFDSDASDWNIVDATPFDRDVIKELSDACQKEGIKFGVYYSQAQDWTHPGGIMSPRAYWDPAQDRSEEAFQKYLDTVSIPQMKEVIRIANPSHLWFDTPFGMTPEIGKKIVRELRSVSPDILLNSRLMYHGREVEGLDPNQVLELREIGVDFLSYRDRTIPAKPFAGWDWETCMTLNGSWGYNASDSGWKTPTEVVKMLSQVVSKGGSFLLNFGPTPEGELQPEGVEVVKQVGEWLEVNGEAIYGASGSDLNKTGEILDGAGVNADGSMKEPGKKKAAKGSRKKKPKKGEQKNIDFDWVATSRPATDDAPAKIYVHVFNWPKGGLEIERMTQRVGKAYVLSDESKSPIEFTQDGTKLTLSLPSETKAPIATVFCLEINQ